MEMRGLLCSSVVFLHTVDMVTEVDGHDAAGVVSVQAQLRMVKGTYFTTHSLTTETPTYLFGSVALRKK